MITKQEYQRLKEICKSSNPDDVRMIGSIILNLRNRKELKRRLVSELFTIVIKNREITKSIHSRMNVTWRVGEVAFRDFKSWQVVGCVTVFGTFKPLEYKWKWLNGEL